MLSVVLLRRINVTGGHVRMADLLETFSDAGYPDAVSVLASGNVIVNSQDPVNSGSIERKIVDRHGFISEAFVRTQPEILDVIDDCPFTNEGAKVEVVFMQLPATMEVIESVGEIATGPDALEVIGREIFWRRPVPLGESIPKERHLKVAIGADSTRRTMATVERIAAKMEHWA